MAIPEYVRWLRSYVGNERLHLASASVLIFDEAKRLLLARPAGRDTWVIPGGVIDPGESPVDAAIREAYEETGLQIEISGIYGVFGGPAFAVQYRNGDVVEYVMTTYTARMIGGTLAPLDEEIEELRFVSEEQLGQMPLAAWARLILPDVFNPDKADRWWLRPTAALQRPQKANTTAPASNSMETA